MVRANVFLQANSMMRKFTNMSELPVGYKIQRDGLTLEVKAYSGERVQCRCSACGFVVPALSKFTKSGLEKWFDRHIELFAKEHSRESL